VLAVISGSLMHVLVPILAGEHENPLRHMGYEHIEFHHKK